VINVDQLVAPFAEEDHDALSRYAIGRAQWLAAEHPTFDAEALVRAWTEEYADRLRWHRTVGAVLKDFRIDDKHREPLEYAFQGAWQAYEGDRVSLQRDKRDVRDLAGLAKGIPETITLLGNLIASGRLVDEMATATSDAFGPGVPRPRGHLIGDDGLSQDAIAWLNRRQSVEMELRETAAQLAAICQVARAEREARRQRPNDPVKAAVAILVEFWRRVLGRPFHSDHNAWNKTLAKGPPEGWDRGDRFAWVAMKAIGAIPNIAASNKVATEMRNHGKKKAANG
jgi:hypothetical protein